MSHPCPTARAPHWRFLLGLTAAVVAGDVLAGCATGSGVAQASSGDGRRSGAPRFGNQVPAIAGANDVEPAQQGSYVVQKGDTLWRIARKHETTFHYLAELNRLTDATQLKVGQRLVVPREPRPQLQPRPASEVRPVPERTQAPVPAPVVEPVKPSTLERPRIERRNGPEPKPRYILRWPAEGPLTARFGKHDKGHHDGVDISAKRGARVRAAFDGLVLFAAQHGAYGNLVLLQHPNGLVTVYAHLDALAVKRGQKVAAWAPVGTVGQTGDAATPHLHFEVRKGVEPQNPLRFLPP